MYGGQVIDVDIHHQWRSMDDIFPYLSEEWQVRLRAADGRRMSIQAARGTWYFVEGSERMDAIPQDGAPAGSSLELMCEQLLDPMDTRGAVLTYNVGLESGLSNPHLAAALCRAANDWTVEHWLSRDDRLRGSILVGPELPAVAAREIRRFADEERMCQVLLVANPLSRPFGHPIYDDIWRAAEETGKAVAIHAGGEGIYKGREAAGGVVSTMLERYEVLHQPGMHYLSSLVTHGVFEKFPGARVILVEFGFAWFPPFVWRLDSSYALLKRECPLVKRLPSEYFRDHLKFSTQPLDNVPPRQFRELLYSYAEFERMLCYSSDYPHWDADEPEQLAKMIPREWRQRVFFENAAEFYGLEGGSEARTTSSPRNLAAQ